ncbi:probable nitrogen fixation protein [Rhizobium tibeticum]|uniref:Probable nitrogen fixation protein n=1 Tax=Rhizobium tibeticum TaxID=501024 RepID=A0A1H8W7W3_9HYPH|nr:putative nitrogen fixation protein [Rhizobium tibeticum]SEP23756.1 probable nitrogen fixation protein [Rhizobium tibeticum]
MLGHFCAAIPSKALAQRLRKILFVSRTMEVGQEGAIPKDQRRAIPIIGDPDPLVLWRLDTFYAAVDLAIEERSDSVVSRTMEISQQGFGRVLFSTKRLVLLSKTLRDAHRFGFNTLANAPKRVRS